MAKQITVRGVPKELSRRLAKLAEVRNQSVNTTVLQLLERATGIDGRRERLAQYTTWTADDVKELDEAIALQRTVDDSLWK
ncbi:MAG: hypothetical protein H0T89_08395 [Deltaproteobacteria bacterium]|nr:hypothetical protein [Deltaproteobacteria bacterium]MDQ3299198.1 hypothetical protein [Myxococcota bacterium]